MAHILHKYASSKLIVAVLASYSPDGVLMEALLWVQAMWSGTMHVV